MPVNFCLPKDRVQTFLKGLKDGEIDPEKMAKMGSKERHEFLGKFVGDEAARKVNAEFESKLLLKNQQQGFLTWAKGVGNIKPEVKRDIITKISRLNKVLDPEEADAFLEDLASTKLGTDVTQQEAKTIADLSSKVAEYEAKRNPDKTFDSEVDRLNYGRAIEDLTEYVSGLKKEVDKLKLGDLKTVSGAGRLVNKTAGNMKSLTASLDNSSIFRQGWKTLITNPNIWRKNATQTFGTIAKTIGGKNVLREVNADIISRPTYDKMVKAKLAIKDPEEAFPESLAEKIPGAGRLYKASEAAYTGFVYKTRADVFDKYLEIAEKSGVNVNDRSELEAIGKLVNSLTGRGSLDTKIGNIERVGNVVNNVFFSPRFLKANIDTLTVHALDKNITPFARKQAAKNLVKVAAATATVLATADALLPGSVDWDPRSTDFGKIKVGNTRFDVTAGMGSIVVLASRLVTGQSKSTGGNISDLSGDVFGSRDRLDVFEDFFRNKLSPAASATVNSIVGKDSLGNDTNALDQIRRSVMPIGIQNAAETMKDPNAANPLLAIIADGLGISASTYSQKKEDSWKKTASKELLKFKEKVGEEDFKQANGEFDTAYDEFLSDTQTKPEYRELSDDDKQALLAKKKAEIKKRVLKSYGFEYKEPKADKNKFKDLLK